MKQSGMNSTRFGSQPEQPKKGCMGMALAVLAILAVACTASSAYANCGPITGIKSAVIQLPESDQADPALAGSADEQPDATPDMRERNSIVGLWHTMYTAGKSPFAETLKEWHSDRTEFENVNHNPAIGSVCVGVWKQVSARTVRLHHLGFLFAENGSPSGTFTVNETDTLDAGGMVYRGRFIFRTYDVNGIFTGTEVTGTVVARRITVN